jgi:flagellar basal body-associated protein FliL|tara:strand:+ start:2792 stop:3289 length:498 start_codon:yes stop_codon:yes gene_type:complete
MKRLVVFFALFILLVIAGAVFWKYGLPLLTKDAEEAESEKAEPSPAKEDKKRTSTANTIALAPMVLPIIKEGKVVQHVTVVIKLLVPDLYAENKLQSRLPRLQDALLTEMYSLLALRFVQENDEEMRFIRRRLLLVGQRILGEGVLENLLIEGVERRQPRTTGTG